MWRIVIFLLFLSITIFSGFYSYSQELPIETRINCSIEAGLKYNIPIDYILPISSIENGRVGQAYKNKNGSIDYGVMQINSVYLKDLEKNYNMIVTPEEVSDDSCYAFEIVAFKINQHLKNDKGTILERVAMYHSKTPDLNKNYQTKIIQQSAIWRNYLRNNKYTLYEWSYIPQ